MIKLAKRVTLIIICFGAGNVIVGMNHLTLIDTACAFLSGYALIGLCCVIMYCLIKAVTILIDEDE